METLVHRRVEAAGNGENPTVICRVRSGWAVLGDNQILRGYSLLLPDPVVPDLNALPEAERMQFCSDMIHLGDALLEVTDAYRINYAVLGNLDPALHAHVTPRYLDEDEDKRQAYGRYENEAALPFDLERDRGLMEAIKTVLVRCGACIRR